MQNWLKLNVTLILLYHTLTQCTSFAQISHSNSVWIMRYSNFWNQNFVDFQILTDCMSMRASDLRQKSVLYSKKPNDAVGVFQFIERKHHCKALGVGFRSELFDTRIWQQRNYFFLKSSFYNMASKIYSILQKFASW